MKNDRYAKANGFSKHEIMGTDFTHVVYLNRLRGQSHWHVYIDGDGRPWRGRYVISPDPTTANPLMLRLMAKDASPSIYLGRPCYHGMVSESACQAWVWTHGRYSEAVVTSMAAALNELIQRQQIEELTLIGHSGGGTLAMLLAEHLQQTKMLVSIAGNMDINQWSLKHGYSHLSGSLNPVDRPMLPQSITQFHFMGMQDENVSLEPVQRLKNTHPNLNYIKVESAGHESGWDDYYCQLLQLTGSRCLPMN